MDLFLKKKFLNIRILLIFFVLLSITFFLAEYVRAGCCISTDYSEVYTAQNAQGCDGYYYGLECSDPVLEEYTKKMCCVLQIEDTNKCYYGSMMFCKYKREQEGATTYILSAGDYGVDGTKCSLSNVDGTCPAKMPEVNCSKTYGIPKGCIAEDSAFFCREDGSLVSDCEFCLDSNCESMVCNRKTGSCELVSANNCTTIGYECCVDCNPNKGSQSIYNYQTNVEGVCPQNIPNCCEECKSEQYCCEFKSQCPTSKGAGECSSGWKCDHACYEWDCALNQRISSSSNTHEVCWCGNVKKYTASDHGYCCQVEGVEGGVYSAVPCSEMGGATLSGSVYDSNTVQPISGARIFLPLYGIVSLPTESDGSYSISGLTLGDTYSVSAYASGYYLLSKYISIDALEKSVDFHLIKIGSAQCNLASPKMVSNFRALGQQGKKEVKLVWDKNCSEFISAYNITRNGWSSSVILPSTADSYIDYNVEWGQTYTYGIQAIYGIISTPKNTTTIKMGNALCEGVLPGYEFCLDSQNRKNTENATFRRSCDEKNEIVPAPTSNEEGRETVNCSEYNIFGGKHECVLTIPPVEEGIRGVVSKCKKKDACLALGNPFGLFYDKNACYASDYECYYEFSDTSVDICTDCSASLKCFDFISEESCLSNKCGLKCNWEYSNEEFSKGICYPQEEYNGTEYCDICNNMFMDCNADDCSKLGKCRTNQEGCSVCPASINCSSYKDEESCNSHPANMIEYCESGKATSKAGTNDICNSLRCVWDSESNKCFKDGNFDAVDDCKDFAALNKIHCEADNTPPITRITTGLTLHLGQSTNFSTNEPVKELHYCIDRDNSCCPSINRTFGTFDDDNGATNIKISPLEDDATQDIFQSNGIYYVRFYSIDKYKNVEAIESATIYVIKNVLDAKVTALFTDANKYNLSIIAEMSAPAKCSFEIIPDITGSIVKNDFASSNYNLQFELMFKDVNYASYSFALNCRDAQSNEYNGTFSLRKYGASKFNVTITAPYYPNGVPAITYGSYQLMLNFSEPVSINNISYKLVRGSYEGLVNYVINSADKKDWTYRIIVPKEEALKEIEGFMNSQLKITAVSDANPNIIYTETDADNQFFTIDTKPPVPEIIID